MPHDGELLRDYAEHGSERAFAELVQRHVDFVYTTALRHLDGDEHRARDVAQGVFTDLARKAGRLADRSTLVGWLHISVHHAAAHLKRSEARRVAREHAAHAMGEIERDAGAAPDWQALRPVLDDAIRELGERDREAVLLRFFEQRPIPEIAATLRIEEEAARKRVTRALDKLHALLTRKGITSTTTALGLLLANQAVVSAPAGLAAALSQGAIAAVATGSGVGATAILLNFMSTTKMVTAAATVAAFVAVGSAVFQYSARREAEAAVATMKQERNEARTKMASADGERQKMLQSLAAERAARGALGTSKASEVKIAANPSQTEYVSSHPETHAAYVQQQVLRARTLWDGFIATLPPEKKEAFLQHLKAIAESQLDMMVAVRSQYGPENQPGPQVSGQLKKMAVDAFQKEGAKAKEILGDELYAQQLEYAKTMPERAVLRQLGGQLYFQDSALTAEQGDQLMKILTANRFSAQSNVMAGVSVSPQALANARVQAGQRGAPLDWVPITDPAIAQAQAVLTPAQVAALREVQAQQLNLIQLTPPPTGVPTK